MARIKRHILFDAVHGQLGDFVIKHYKFGSVLSRKPRFGKIPPSEKQLAQRERGRSAGEYYRRVMADPALAMVYEFEAKKKGYPISALTWRDFSVPPTVHAIDLSRYNGCANQVIAVTAFDDTFVKTVEVTLRDDAGNVLEHGPAVDSHQREGWLYHATCNVPLGASVTVEAVAVDLPGNRGTRIVKWERPMIGSMQSVSPPAPWMPPKLDFDPRAG